MHPPYMDTLTIWKYHAQLGPILYQVMKNTINSEEKYNMQQQQIQRSVMIQWDINLKKNKHPIKAKNIYS